MRGVVLALLCAACGGSVNESPGNGGAVGNAGAVGSGGAVGNGGSSAGGSSGSACLQTSAHFDAELSTSSSAIDPPPVCNTNEWNQYEWSGTGIVVSSSNNTTTIDLCSPMAFCLPTLVNVSSSAPNLLLTIPVGAIVRVDYATGPTWYACSQRLSIVNVPNWGGFENPVSSDSDLYLAAADGTFAAPEGAPFSIEAVSLGCPASGNGCGGTTYPPGSYALAFSNAAGTVIIPMGQKLPIGMGFSAHNLRSFVSGACDDYWDWGYWVSREN